MDRPRSQPSLRAGRAPGDRSGLLRTPHDPAEPRRRPLFLHPVRPAAPAEARLLIPRPGRAPRRDSPLWPAPVARPPFNPHTGSPEPRFRPRDF